MQHIYKIIVVYLIKIYSIISVSKFYFIIKLYDIFFISLICVL